MEQKTQTVRTNPTAKRMTKQRRLIKDILYNTKEHPTAEMVYQEAKKSLPDIGLGTVYRNLQILVEENSVIELNCGGRVSRYDGNTKPHCHFVCTECGNVYDVEVDMSKKACQKVAPAINGKIDYCRVEFYGRCDECLKKAKIPV
jgi:Fur family peroxide stress response transcriptional regulator